MLHYVGLDVSMKTTFICIVNDSGKTVYENTVPSEPSQIAHDLMTSGFDIKLVTLESGSISHWLTSELRKLSLPVVCIDARCMSKILAININKTDKNDARLIAEAARCGFYNEVHLKTQADIDLKIMLNSRRTLKNVCTQLKNTIRGHLKAFGIRLTTISKSDFSIQVRSAIQDKADIVQLALNSMLNTYEVTLAEIMKIEIQIKELAKNDEDVQLLTTIPGIGIITAFTFKAYLGDPKRFHNSRAVGAHFGMTPRQYASGETQIQGRISKQGSPEVRAMLTEAATSLLYRTKSWSKLKAWGMKLKRKKGHKKTVLALGRKLATVMYRMMITRKVFEYGDSKNVEVQEVTRKTG